MQHERKQCEHAALAVVVRLEDEDQVLHHHDEDDDQITSDMTPTTFGACGMSPCRAANASLTVYSGLVPSPYTTPSAMSDRMSRRRPTSALGGA